MIEDLRYYKHEQNKIKAEIDDLKSRIIVEGARGNRFEVDNYRNRINRLKMKYDEISLKIVELEKMIKKTEPGNQIQSVSNSGLAFPSIKDGKITVTDSIIFDRGYSDGKGMVVQTVKRTVKRTTFYKNNEPVYTEETVDESITTAIPENRNEVYIESSLAD